RVTGNFTGHGEAGLDPGENLASARTISELVIPRGHKNYSIRAREHRSATLGSFENHSRRSVGRKLFSGPDCPGGETLRSRYGFARRGRIASGRSGGASWGAHRQLRRLRPKRSLHFLAGWTTARRRAR